MGSLFQHILVPVDFTEKNTAALDVASELATHSDARLTLLHVIEAVEHAEDEEMQEFYNMLEAKARANMEALAPGLAAEGRAVEQAIVFGRRGEEIVRYSMEQEADLIVLSSHRLDEKQAAGGWATLSYQVSILCPCDVLLVK